MCPSYGSGLTIPLTYTNDQTALSAAPTLQPNHIVVNLISSMMIATYDDTGSNGNIFLLVCDVDTYALSLEIMKTTTGAQPNSL